MHETLGKGLTPAGTFPAGGDERSGGSDVEVAFLVATGAEAEPLLRLVRTPREEMVAGKPWWTCRFAKGQGSGAAVILQSGYDKTNTAHSLTCLLETVRPELVLQVGVGGAFREAGLGLGDIVVATEEIYADTGVRTPDGWISTKEFNSPLLEKDGHLFWNRFPLDDGLASRCAKVIADGEWGASTPKIVAGPCVTLSEVSGSTARGDELHRRWGALLESMEGAAAAHVCAIYDVPFLEIRSVSNLVVDRDRESWEVGDAAKRAAQAAIYVCSRLDEVLT